MGSSSGHDAASNRNEILARLSFERYLSFLERESLESHAVRSSGLHHSNVRNLEERFEQLFARSKERMSSTDLVASYECRVRTICDRLEPLGDSEPTAGAKEAVKLISNFVDGRQGSLFRPVPSATGKNTVPNVDPTSDSAMMPRSLPSRDTVKEKKFQPISVSAATKSRLDKQQQQQEILTDDVVDLSSQLKESVKGLGAKVAVRNQLLDQAGAALETSVGATQRNVTSIEKTRRKMRMNMCFSVLALLAMMAALGGVLVFIRVTSIVGYRNTPRASPLMNKGAENTELR
jgi:hypothetical protein